MSTSKNQDERSELSEGMRALRERERQNAPPASGREGPGAPPSSEAKQPLGAIERPGEASPPPLVSPDREALNAGWNVAEAMSAAPAGGLGRLLSFVRPPLQKLVRFALGPVVEHQSRLNSAQVHFDNVIVRYIDERMDRINQQYDRILGLHGKRMEEIDERHLILQQELIRHVHDLVERIEFVFESAEQNHLYLEGMLRETKEDLAKLLERWERSAAKK